MQNLTEIHQCLCRCRRKLFMGHAFAIQGVRPLSCACFQNECSFYGALGLGVCRCTCACSAPQEIQGEAYPIEISTDPGSPASFTPYRAAQLPGSLHSRSHYCVPPPPMSLVPLMSQPLDGTHQGYTRPWAPFVPVFPTPILKPELATGKPTPILCPPCDCLLQLCASE